MSQLLFPVRHPTAAAGAGLCLLTLAFAKKRARPGSFGAGSEQPEKCRLCRGSGRRVCQTCAGRGRLERGGFARKNPIRLASLVGSKWTSVSAIDGKWRHFLCIGRRGKTTRDTVAHLTSTCGPVAQRIKLDVPVAELKSRASWAAGWTTLIGIADRDAQADDPAAAPGAVCSACRGRGAAACPRCDGLGQVGL